MFIIPNHLMIIFIMEYWHLFADEIWFYKESEAYLNEILLHNYKIW